MSSPPRSSHSGASTSQRVSWQSEVKYSDRAASGKFDVQVLPEATITVGGDAELPITAKMTVYAPAGSGQKAPLVIFSPGFLINSSMYQTYARHLASWGYAVLLYDINEVMDDAETLSALKQVTDYALQGRDPRWECHISPNGCVLAGHSRGGKLSCLAAAKDARVTGLLLLDPVDNTPMTPAGAGYPSALPGLIKATSKPRSLPVLIVGAGSGGDVVPESSNYKRFARACLGPCWSVELQGAGHLAFLDKQIGLFSMFSSPGTTDDATVRQACRHVMTSWMLVAAVPQQAAHYDAASELRYADAALRQLLNNTQTQRSQHLDLLPSAVHSSPVQHMAAPPATGAIDPEEVARQYTWENLQGMRARKLKELCAARGIDASSVVEKDALVELLGGKRPLTPPPSQPPPSRATSQAAPSAAVPPPPPPPPSAHAGAAEARHTAGAGAGSSSMGAAPDSAGGGQVMSKGELMGMRAKQLKDMCIERGIPTDDVFDKDTLVQRLVAASK